MREIINRFCRNYDKIFNKTHTEKIKHFTVILSIILFLLHLSIVFLADITSNNIRLFEGIKVDYFSTIFTPFSIILFYEVFLLLIALPNSITKSVAKQYEIITLIIVLRVFKDVSELGSITDIAFNGTVIRNIILDIGTSIILIGLLSLFYVALRKKQELINQTERIVRNNSILLIQVKKIITTFVLVILLIAFGYSFLSWGSSQFGEEIYTFFSFQSQFFIQLFSIMVFVDILFVLLSYYFTDDFAIIFRDVGFVISIIFIRFSISTTERPIDLGLAVIAIVIGVLTAFLYTKFSKSRNAFFEARNNGK